MQPGPWGIRYLITAQDDDRTDARRSEPDELPTLRPEAWAAWAKSDPAAPAVEPGAPLTRPAPDPTPGPALPGGGPAGAPAR